MNDPLGNLPIPKPFYRRPLTATLASSPDDSKKEAFNPMAEAFKKAGLTPEAPQEKGSRSPEEASAEIRKIASDAIAQIMEAVKGGSADAQALAGEAMARINGEQDAQLKNLASPAKKPKTQVKPIPAPDRAAGRPLKDLSSETLRGVGINPSLVRPESTVQPVSEPKPVASPESTSPATPELVDPKIQVQREVEMFMRTINDPNTPEKARDETRQALLKNYSAYVPGLREKLGMPTAEPTPKVPEAPVSPGLQEAFDEKGDLKLVPEDQMAIDRAATEGMTGTLPPTVKKSVEPKPLKSTVNVPEAKPAPIAEVKAPESDFNKEGERLKKEIADLRNTIETLKAAAEKKAASPAQAESAKSEMSPPLPSEVKEGPHLRQIRELASDKIVQEQAQKFESEMRTSILDRLKARAIRRLHEVNRFAWLVLAKRAKDNVAKLDTQIEKLKKDQQEFSEKSFLHTAIAPLWYRGFGGKWYGFYFKGLSRLESLREDSAAAAERYNAYRERRENVRAEAINMLVAREDVDLRGNEARAMANKKKAEQIDQDLEKVYGRYEQILSDQTQESDPAKKVQQQAELRVLLAMIQALTNKKAEAENTYTRHHAKAGRQRARKDWLLKMVELPGPVTGVDLQHESVPKKPRRSQSKIA